MKELEIGFLVTFFIGIPLLLWAMYKDGKIWVMDTVVFLKENGWMPDVFKVDLLNKFKKEVIKDKDIQLMDLEYQIIGLENDCRDYFNRIKFLKFKFKDISDYLEGELESANSMIEKLEYTADLNREGNNDEYSYFQGKKMIIKSILDMIYIIDLELK